MEAKFGTRCPLGLVLSSIVLSSIVLSGCGDAAIDDSVASLEDELLGAKQTWERPEVGMIRFPTDSCTATLVARNVLISAAHCVDYHNSRQPGDYADFIISKAVEGKVKTYSYPVDAYRSFGLTSGTNDLAILRLAEPVPSSVARPVPLASSTPAPFATITRFGYGCANRSTRAGALVKRKVEFAFWTDTKSGCPGDSGGPTFTPDGKVFQITSAYWVDSGTDAVADVTHRWKDLRAQVLAWAK